MRLSELALTWKLADNIPFPTRNETGETEFHLEGRRGYMGEIYGIAKLWNALFYGPENRYMEVELSSVDN